MKRKYSWIPDIPDFRDFKLDNKMLKLVRKLPDSVDLRPYCSKIEDQETLGSCTGNAIVGALEYLENKVEKDISGNVFDGFANISNIPSFVNGISTINIKENEKSMNSLK